MHFVRPLSVTQIIYSTLIVLTRFLRVRNVTRWLGWTLADGFGLFFVSVHSKRQGSKLINITNSKQVQVEERHDRSALSYFCTTEPLRKQFSTIWTACWMTYSVMDQSHEELTRPSVIDTRPNYVSERGIVMEKCWIELKFGQKLNILIEVSKTKAYALSKEKYPRRGKTMFS